jgi:hypothetical protein
MSATADAAVTRTDPDFVFTSTVDDQLETADITSQPGGDLGPLAQLPGTWKGHGFNTIWRPHHGGGQDRFLELNLTTETLVFTKINGPIPNRGFLMADINMHGLTYMQQIAETSTGDGLHIEPGIWVHVPPTTSPKEPSTIARLASIPHGTVILAQGTGETINGAPTIPDNNIIPFGIGSPAPANSDFHSGEQTFTELNLGINTTFRSASPGVTQEMVKNPNHVLQKALTGHTVKSRTFLHVTTTHNPVKGGGIANTAFLADAGTPPDGNAKASVVDAKFWIETIAGSGGGPDTLQLQYSQLVQLDFNGLRWPHVTVGTLHKQ